MEIKKIVSFFISHRKASLLQKTLKKCWNAMVLKYGNFIMP